MIIFPQSFRVIFLIPAFIATLSWPGGGIASLHAQDALFGSKEETPEALIGILYDLKQTQELKATDMDPNRYFPLIDNFLSSGWDESVLSPFYRTTRALYTTQLMIPVISADRAPEAFGVEKLVKPRLWVVHYKAQVLPPHAGKFRFAGYSDDFIALAINGETKLVGGRVGSGTMKKTKWKSTEGQGLSVANGRLTYSDWIELDGTQPVDLDVIVGERPGGQFAALLYWQEEGKTYSSGKDGLILPPLQFAPGEIPDKVPHAEGFPLWKVVP